MASLVQALFGGILLAQVPVQELIIRADPEVRPLESLVLQLVAYGEVEASGGEGRKVRLPVYGAKFHLPVPATGWLSKPFRFQGEESEPFYEKEGSKLSWLIFNRASTEFVMQDAVLFTAPERPGLYKVEATLPGSDRKAALEISVAPAAVTRRKPETTSFRAERKESSRYRALAEHYAPFIAQETWFEPKSDFLARFDFDGDWKGENNWESTETGSSQAYVYYTAMETETHWFLIYNFFHPRDYSDKCVAGTCHENDNEGMVLTIRKDRSRYGQLQVMETLAHNNIYSYSVDRTVRKGIHNLDGRIRLHDGSQPVIFIESGGHGVYGAEDFRSRYRDGFTAGTGITYVYKGIAERPRHANDQAVGYELLPIYEHWWLRAGQEGSEMFDDYFVYAPFGPRRPRPIEPRLPGSFKGRKMAENKAKPFWGWHDQRTLKKKALNTGQWVLDPAYSVSRNLNLPKPFSVKYVFNPYLGIGESR